MRRVILFYFIFLIYFPNEQRAGEGGSADRRFFFPPCSADHERDWPPCKVVFFGLATNALNVRNNNNNNIAMKMPVLGETRPLGKTND